MPAGARSNRERQEKARAASRGMRASGPTSGGGSMSMSMNAPAVQSLLDKRHAAIREAKKSGSGKDVERARQIGAGLPGARED